MFPSQRYFFMNFLLGNVSYVRDTKFETSSVISTFSPYRWNDPKWKVVDMKTVRDMPEDKFPSHERSTENWKSNQWWRERETTKLKYQHVVWRSSELSTGKHLSTVAKDKVYYLSETLMRKSRKWKTFFSTLFLN